MKTQFHNMLGNIKEMATSAINDRMEGCDILTFENRVYLGKGKGVTHMKRDIHGVSVYDGENSFNPLHALDLEDICLISDALK